MSPVVVIDHRPFQGSPIGALKMRIQKQVPAPRGVRRAWITTASRRNVATAEWVLRYMRNDNRRFTSPVALRGFRVIAPK
jgi:hypothetical protein